jgi:hypothetical protein
MLTKTKQTVFFTQVCLYKHRQNQEKVQFKKYSTVLLS